MGQPQFYNGKLLIVNGAIAMDPACCCADDCTCTILFYVYNIDADDAVDPELPDDCNLLYHSNGETPSGGFPVQRPIHHEFFVFESCTDTDCDLLAFDIYMRTTLGYALVYSDAGTFTDAEITAEIDDIEDNEFPTVAWVVQQAQENQAGCA